MEQDSRILDCSSDSIFYCYVTSFERILFHAYAKWMFLLVQALHLRTPSSYMRPLPPNLPVMQLLQMR